MDVNTFAFTKSSRFKSDIIHIYSCQLITSSAHDVHNTELVLPRLAPSEFVELGDSIYTENAGLIIAVVFFSACFGADRHLSDLK